MAIAALLRVLTQSRYPFCLLRLDDAPGELTPQLLALLAAHGARATFFVIAHAAERHPQRLADIAAAGHELGNHMVLDQPSWRLSPREFAAQVAQVEELLSRHRAGDDTSRPRWFRPGHGVFRRHMMPTLRSHGLTGALGSAYGCVGGRCAARMLRVHV
jgi:peptidoglycan/xylan/chitin deacetylase (PgdA/CDA1 family)